VLPKTVFSSKGPTIWTPWPPKDRGVRQDRHAHPGPLRTAGGGPAQRIPPQSAAGICRPGGDARHPPHRQSILDKVPQRASPWTKTPSANTRTCRAGVSEAVVRGRTVLVGNDALLHQKISPRCVRSPGHRHACGHRRQYAGYLLMGDAVKPDAAAAVAGLRKGRRGTGGDAHGRQPVRGRGGGRQLGMDAFHASLMPEDKVAILEQIMARPRRRQTGIRGRRHQRRAGDRPGGRGRGHGRAGFGRGHRNRRRGADDRFAHEDGRSGAHRPPDPRHRLAEHRHGAGGQGLFVVLGAMGVASMWEAVFADVGVALAAVVNATRALKTASFKL
jgi:hypothetical protein